MSDWPLCIGQAVIALLLFLILCGVASYQKRLDKIQLAVQELCDRIWDTKWGDGLE